MILNNIPRGGTLGGKIMVKHVQENEFSAEVLNFDGVSVVDFWASWCGPCKMIAPIFEEVDENPNLANQFRIASIPTILIMKNGAPVDTLVGFMPKPQLKDAIAKHV